MAIFETQPSLTTPFGCTVGCALRNSLIKTTEPKQADKAISSIKPGHIQEVKKLPNPADVIKMVFDCILLLFHLPVNVAARRKLHLETNTSSLFDLTFLLLHVLLSPGHSCCSGLKLLRWRLAFVDRRRGAQDSQCTVFLCICVCVLVCLHFAESHLS